MFLIIILSLIFIVDRILININNKYILRKENDQRFSINYDKFSINLFKFKRTL